MTRAKKRDLINSVPVACPKCGSEGHVQIEKLNRGLVCRKCQTRFYIDHTGQRTLGDPALPKDDFGFNLPGAKRARKQSRAEQWVRDQWVRFCTLPRWIQFSSVGAAAIVLTGLLAFWMTLPAAIELPEGITARAHYVGEALARNDRRALYAVCARGTADEAEQWLAAVRPAFWPQRVPLDVHVKVGARVASQDRAAGRSIVLIEVSPPPGSVAGGRSGAAPGSIELPTVWSMLGTQWVLDGKQTLAQGR